MSDGVKSMRLLKRVNPVFVGSFMIVQTGGGVAVLVGLVVGVVAGGCVAASRVAH